MFSGVKLMTLFYYYWFWVVNKCMYYVKHVIKYSFLSKRFASL